MARTALLLSTSGALIAGFIGLGIGPVAAGSSLSACLADCKRPQLSATNRASCRLDCENEAASDPEQIRAQMARQSPVAPTTAKASAELRRAPLSCKSACDAERSLSVDDRASCKLDCEQEALAVPGATPEPTAPDVMRLAPPVAGPPTQAGFLGRCYATCRPGTGQRATADFETCKLDCETMASVLEVARGAVHAWLAPPVSPAQPRPVAQPPSAARVAVKSSSPRPVTTPTTSARACEPALERCNIGCSKHESRCSRSCGRLHRSETDRETCKLTCGTDREVCQGDCLAASASCMNSQVGR